MKVGIIGLGEVSQLMHLPILQDLTEDYTITAVSDISPSLVAFIQKKYHIKEGYTSSQELIEKSDTDAIFVLTPDQFHGEIIAQALKAGKNIFVEKPVTLFSGEVEELMQLEKQYPKQLVMVGYMRRYSASFLKMKEILQETPQRTEYLRFRDIICEGPFYIGQTRQIFYPNDVPKAAIEDGKTRRRAYMDKALGTNATESQRMTHMMFTGLGSHSFSVVRELFGLPKKIHSVTTARGGEHIVIVMEFDGFLATYELVNNQNIVQFDAAVEVFQGKRKLLLKYETPYLRYQPHSLEVIESDEKETKTSTYGPNYTDAFQTELIEFAAHVKNGTRPKTILQDSLADLKLFEDIIKVLQTKGGET